VVLQEGPARIFGTPIFFWSPMRGAPIFQVKFREQDSYIFLGEVTGEFFLLEGGEGGNMVRGTDDSSAEVLAGPMR
jgi:hypothetical protein